MERQQKGEVLSPDQQAIIAQRESEKLELLVQQASVIKSDVDLRNATEMLAQVKLVSKNIKGQKDPIIKDLMSSISRVRALFKPAEDRLTEAERILKTAILSYHEKVEARAAKKAEKIEAAVDAGELDMADGMAKLAKVKQADTVVNATSGSAQIRVTKKLRITDAAALPAHYFMRPRVLEALRIEVAEDVLRNKLPVPTGAEVYEEKGVAGING